MKKLRTYKVYWLELYPKRENLKTLKLPKYKKVTGVYSDGVIEVEGCKKIKAKNLDELIDILREVLVDEGFEVFSVFNPEKIKVLDENDLINRR
jgi:hypothetical protein